MAETSIRPITPADIPAAGPLLVSLNPETPESVVRERLETILSEHTGHDAAQLRHDTDRDRVFDAAGAVEYGLADRVLRDRVLGDRP